MNNIEVSVVIPMYNSKDTIERALNSVVNQTYNGNMEIIVINDGSKDNSLEIVENYKNKLIKSNIEFKIIDKKNGGVSTARNAGLKIASGKYIALLDSDDEWLKNKLKIQIEQLNENIEIDFLGCERNQEKTKIFFKELKGLNKVKLNDLLIKMFPQTSTAIFKKEILKEVGYYDENQKYAEDGNFWLRICAKKTFYMYSETLVITGDGKPNFGHSGLSANLTEMEKGCQKNLKEMYELKNINIFYYYFYKIFYCLKYLRRIAIVKLRKVS
ncbi:MAG: glycosyltransferase family 2 protein [Fusobacteriaceae bacterium]